MPKKPYMPPGADTRDYKQKLADFIAIFKDQPGEVSSGTPLVTRDMINDATKGMSKEDKAAFRWKGTLQNNQDFFNLTGLNHTALVANWSGGGHLTSCNGFSGLAGARMGLKFNTGVFYLREALETAGLAHAWVPADSGRLPDYGDIFEDIDYMRPEGFRNLHVGVSLGFTQGKWKTIQGGQGGARAGADKVALRLDDFDRSKLKGWISTRLLLDGPVPEWLLGWWTVWCGDTAYNYHFDRFYEVTYALLRPVNGGQRPPDVPFDKGTFTVKGGDQVEIAWENEPGIEQFLHDRYNSVPALREEMNGRSPSGQVLKGIK